MIRFHKYKKTQKEYKAPKSTKKYKNTINLRFIEKKKNALKKHLIGKK